MKFRYIAGILLAAIMAAATVFLAAGCDEDETVAATGVTLSKTELSLTVGESFTLTATVTPDNATDKSVTWTSSDPAVATVEGGEVTAVAEGGATITAACGEVSASVSCTVSAAQEPDRTTVTEAEWEAAFAKEKFENFHMTIGYYRTDAEGNELDDIPNIVDYTTDGEREKFTEVMDNGNLTAVTRYSQKTDSGYLWYLNESGQWRTEEEMQSLIDDLSVMEAFYRLPAYFADFAYDETAQSYSATLETLDGNGGDMPYEVTFENGVLTQVGFSWENGNGWKEYFTFDFTFGGQSVLLPEISDRTTVTEEEWNAAFAEENFENFRMTVDVFAVQDGEYIPVYTMEYIAADGKRYIAANGIGESAAFREETFEVYSETEIVKYSRQTDGSWETTEQQYSGDRHNGIKGIPLSGWRALRGKYKDFMQPSADEEAYFGTVYVAGEGVDSGAVPTWDDYKVAFKNGVLSTVECSPAADSNSMEALKIAFTFGGQSIQLPETGPSAGSREEWDAAFSADKFENMKFEVRDLNGAQTPAMDYIVADGKEYLKRTGVRNSIPFTDEFYSLQTQTEYTQYYRDSKSQWKSRSSQNSLLIDEGEGFGDVLLAPLKDAYENFTYDDAQKCYVGKMDFGGELFDVKVVIENGMLSQISGTPEQCLITFTFGDQIVELPPEIGAIS